MRVWRGRPRVALARRRAAAVAGDAPDPARRFDLGAPREIASGITLYHLAEPSLLDPPAPVSIWLLRVNAGAADLRAVLSNDAIVDTEIVPDIAARHGAIAAINAGFFLLPSGDPSGIYKLRGQLVSDTKRPRGALGIARDASGLRLLFGRVAATMNLRVPRRARLDAVVEIAGVDTTRQRGRLMLFTPAYHQHTDTPATGLEWVLQGQAAARHQRAAFDREDADSPRWLRVVVRRHPAAAAAAITARRHEGRTGHELHGRRRQRRRLGEGRRHRRRRRTAAARRADHQPTGRSNSSPRHSPTPGIRERSSARMPTDRSGS